MVVLYNKMFTAFHKLFLPIKNNLLGSKDDKHINKQKKNIKKLTRKEERHTNNGQEEWLVGGGVDVEKYNNFLDKEVFKRDMNRIISYYDK